MDFKDWWSIVLGDRTEARLVATFNSTTWALW